MKGNRHTGSSEHQTRRHFIDKVCAGYTCTAKVLVGKLVQLDLGFPVPNTVHQSWPCEGEGDVPDIIGIIGDCHDGIIRMEQDL
jgi:hypothetical protein